jgi:hypothetical protein
MPSPVRGASGLVFSADRSGHLSASEALTCAVDLQLLSGTPTGGWVGQKIDCSYGLGLWDGHCSSRQLNTQRLADHTCTMDSRCGVAGP